MHFLPEGRRILPSTLTHIGRSASCEMHCPLSSVTLRLPDSSSFFCIIGIDPDGPGAESSNSETVPVWRLHPLL
eukprot:scaffold35211_cov112-Isochrysis_galbana.AAC.1